MQLTPWQQKLHKSIESVNIDVQKISHDLQACLVGSWNLLYALSVVRTFLGIYLLGGLPGLKENCSLAYPAKLKERLRVIVHLFLQNRTPEL